MHTDRPGKPPDGAGKIITHNLFFGLLPDDTTRERIALASGRLRVQHAPRGRWLKPERYHLTLHFLGRFRPLRESIVVAAREAASRVHAPPFDLVLDHAGAFIRNGVGWLGCTRPDAGLQLLRERLRRTLAEVHIEVENAPGFHPHITVLRDALDPLPSGAIEPIVWPVHEFVLVDSQHGARNVFEQAGRWRLAAH